MGFLIYWLCVLLGLLLLSSEGGGWTCAATAWDAYCYCPLMLEHHAGHAGVVGNEGLGRSLGRPDQKMTDKGQTG